MDYKDNTEYVQDESIRMAQFYLLVYTGRSVFMHLL